MPGTEGAPDSAMHDPGAAGPQVRQSPTRARNAPPLGRANGSGASPRRASTVRSALEIARERWGTPVGPVTALDGTALGGQPRQPGDSPAAARDALASWRIWSEPSPSMSAIWADMKDGAGRQGAYGAGWLVPYWLFGLLAFPVACAARLLLDSSARPGRFAALLVAVLLFIAGLLVAGVI